MLIGKNWKIDSDKLNVTLYQRHVAPAKNGKPKHDYWTTEGYFSTVKNALKFLIDQGVAETNLTDLKTIAKKQEELHQLIDNMKGDRNV